MDQIGQYQPLVVLQPMPQWAELRDCADDWTGVTNTAQRRKLQNRLNQRARRRRKMQSHLIYWKEDDSNTGYDTANSVTAQPPQLMVDQHHELTCGHGQSSADQCCQLKSREKRAFARRFAQQAYMEYVGGTHCLSNLPTLLTVNTFNALCQNATVVRVSGDWLTCDAISPFCREGPGLGPSTMEPTAAYPWGGPESLRPTELQISTPHHPWIDLFPLPRFRDNALLAISQQQPIDEDELCIDIAEVGDDAPSDKATLIIWGDPWDPRGWEASLPFIRKWGALLQGCSEILEATNYWREKRGEKTILFRV